MLIHIVLSIQLSKHLLKQKDKEKSIKTGVNLISKPMMLLTSNEQHTYTNLVKE